MPDMKSQVKRKAPELELPRPGEDAAERKRVLNVLAQRRYRQRRKEHLQNLEAQVSNTEAGTIATPHTTAEVSNAPSSIHADQVLFEPSTYLEEVTFEGSPPHREDTLNQCQLLTPEADPFATQDASLFEFPTDNQCFWDASILLPSLPSTPLSESTHSSNQSTTWSLTSLPGIDGPPPKSPSHPPSPAAPLGQDIQYSFPDEAHLEMTELTLLRGCMSIARRMNIQEMIWSLTSTSPFTEPAMAMAQFNHLPLNLQPTALQMTMAHHPLIDLLPWPSVRDRIIMVLSQPPDLRPSGAASPMALLEFVYDIEDSAEGIRISGNDPYSGNNWEIGEKVFKSWWWMFDKAIIRRSNELRAARGAPLLGNGSVLGEVA
ncbi:uncharacterized protein Z518_02137 [Rhinocladiella mackenziei CBS 650.93]|uniref:BZIP domain-containing protein n=1 Tax=Rhinocladiella mackenziei CBS 650.93 TaxID=1442369 RepID=A0A0D2INW5_9EURO|nr:uncharacterized protein Z518_02137 [Rhinocladiella mackenziei CBS 650.93]KIX07484.1 hypothetical protein Z518_02137 [Rhinocladiella mackenziei CBS 650.93]